jgi:predicted small secreted protein
MVEVFMKKNNLVLLLIAALIVSACNFWGVRGNGRIKSETRNILDFEKIDAGGAFSIKIKVGPSTSLRIVAEENLIGYIRTNVKGNTLVIDTRKNVSPRKEIIIEITTPSLKSVDASGANNIYIDGINGAEFRVDLSGAGNIDLRGTVDKFRAELSGAGNIDARDLIAKEVRVSVSGAASADVHAKEYLEASVSGVGSIDYYGNPAKVKTDVSGVGSISRK